ncbi:MAG: hypothetical protein M3P08_19800 [Thermoproteota archaeon]|nr:hypothetical protein [Thermoproteota archaeon]
MYNPHSYPIESTQLIRRLSKMVLRSKTAAKAREAVKKLLPSSAWKIMRRNFLPVKDGLTQKVVLETQDKPTIPEDARTYLKRDISR